VAAAWLWGPNTVGEVDVEHKSHPQPGWAPLVSAAADVQLLIVGHGHHVIDMMHRSVSWYCARHAHCLVLVIPAAAATRKTLGGPRRDYCASRAHSGHYRQAHHGDYGRCSITATTDAIAVGAWPVEHDFGPGIAPE
jgi:hypothetical protein